MVPKAQRLVFKQKDESMKMLLYALLLQSEKNPGGWQGTLPQNIFYPQF